MTTLSQSQQTALWAAVAGARIIDLAQPMRRGMPQSPNHPPFQMALQRRHGDYVRADGGSAANEIIITGGHVGTHVDALAHVSQDGKVFGGVDAYGIQSHEGFAEHGIDAFPPFVGRGVVLDVARLRGVDSLPPGYEVTAEDLQEAADAAAVDVRPGDAVLIGTGWSRRWDEKDAFIGLTDGVPGPGTAAAQWLVDRQVAVAGGLDAEVAEILLVLAPLRIVGATGAPVRPLAVLPADGGLDG